MNITIDVNGLKLPIEHLMELANRMIDDVPAMHEIIQRGRESTALNFEYQGRPPWVDLSPLTLTRRHRKGIESDQILIATGETMESFVGEGNAHTVFVVEEHLAEWGNSRVDFPLHDQGSSHEPQRQILVHLQEDIEYYSETYLAYLTDVYGEQNA